MVTARLPETGTQRQETPIYLEWRDLDGSSAHIIYGEHSRPATDTEMALWAEIERLDERLAFIEQQVDNPKREGAWLDGNRNSRFAL
jgi:hypothetical protein